MEERIQKILAKSGLGSRRVCEEYIILGRVGVNGKTAKLGDKADPEKDHITMDGKRIQVAEPLKYVALYKPRNVISAVTSPDPRPTVRDLIPLTGRLWPVGRLDIESEGLILLTNDGDLTNRLTHPRYGADKEYRVLVPYLPDHNQLNTWRRGVVLPDGHKTAPANIKIESESPRGIWLRVTMHEGRKRQIREVGETLGIPVKRIIRVRIGALHVGRLKPREWRELTPQEIAALKGTGENKPKKSGKRGSGKSPRKPRTNSSTKENAAFQESGEYKPKKWVKRGDSKRPSKARRETSTKENAAFQESGEYKPKKSLKRGGSKRPSKARSKFSSKGGKARTDFIDTDERKPKKSGNRGGGKPRGKSSPKSSQKRGSLKKPK